MANTGRLGKASFKKESTWGTYVDPDKNLSITSETVINKIEHVEDGRFIGKIFTTDMIKVGQMVDGSLELTVHPEEFGPLINGALGKNASPATTPSARVIIYYTGTDAYAGVDKTAGTITGKSGATLGTAVNAFALDTTAAAYDTLTELVAAIDAVSGWNAYLVGTSSASSGIADFLETQIKDSTQAWALIKQVDSVSSTTKLHNVYPAGAADAEPSYSLCFDRTYGTNKAIGYSGCKINSFALKLSSKAIVTASVALTGKLEATAKTYPTITIPSDRPYVAGKARVFIGGVESLDVKELNINLNNNLDTSNVVGSDYIIEQIRQGATLQVSGSLNFNLTTWERNYPFYTTDTPLEMIVYIEGTNYADLTNGVLYSIMIKIPSVKFTKFDTNLTGPDRITTSIEGTAVEKSGFNHIDCYVVDTQTSAY